MAHDATGFAKSPGNVKWDNVCSSIVTYMYTWHTRGRVLLRDGVGIW